MMRKTVILCALSALLLASALPAPADGKAPADTSKATQDNYAKLTAGNGVESVSGFISIHRKDGKVYLEIPDAVMGRELVFGATVKSTSDIGAGLVGSKRDLLLFSFHRDDDKVQLRERNVEYVSEGEPMAASTAGAILKSLKVEAWSPDSSSVVVNATDLFLEDEERLSPFVGYSTYDAYKLDKKYRKDYSYVTGAKAFDDNVSVSVSRTYSFSASDGNGRKLIDNQPLTAQMTYSILLLPQETYKPRINDPRIGYFFTSRSTMPSIGTSSREVWLTNRWRMEPSDTAAWLRGVKVSPKKQIVFYIDPCFPSWWKPYIHRAVDAWSKPFERIGFKDAVVARDFPTPEEDPAFDPDNIKYSCIRYQPLGIQNAMGPSWVDPRTGEILNASVYVYHDVVRLVSQWMFVQTAAADPSVRTMDIPEAKLGDALEYVIRHEVGHCLGLMHNMGASASISVDELRDPEFTAENGTTWSIMDYARFNYVAQPGDGARLTPPEFGKYDYWAIRWGYEPILDAASFAEETARSRRMITDSLDAAPWYRYGKQQMYAQYYDPRNQSEDLGDDVIAASRYGMANLKTVAANFMDWLSDGDPEYEYRTFIYQGIVNQYLRYANHILMNVGGLERNEVVAGDGQKRFRNIPASKQEACLREIFSMLETLDWIEDKAVLERLPVLGSPARTLRQSIFSTLMSRPYFCGYSDGVDTREMDYHQCMDLIFDFVWEPTRRGRALTEDQRMYQMEFVKSLITSGSLPAPQGMQSFSAAALPGPGAVEFDSGYLSYDPVSGFEWLPRAIFNRGNISSADMYAVLTRVHSLVKGKVRGARPLDRAHYELIQSYIEYATSLK